MSRLSGRERAVRLGGHGTPLVAEFAAAEFGARAGVSAFAGREMIADALDLQHRFPRLWGRVQALEVRASYARFVTRRCRDLTLEQAGYVDEQVAEPADGRVSWARFELLVYAAIKGADPGAAAAREERAAKVQYACAGRRDHHGMRGFFVRAQLGLVARLDALVAHLAEILGQLGDTDPVHERRVKAVLLLTDPARAASLLAAYAEWKERPADPGDLVIRDTEDPDHAAHADVHRDRRGPRPDQVDLSRLLPSVQLFVHLYGGCARCGKRDGNEVARVEGSGPLTEAWVRSQLGPHARFRVTPVLDLEGQAPVDAYEIPERHRQAVHLMTPADIFPFANDLSRTKQVDHTDAYEHDAYEPDAYEHGAGADGPPRGQSRIGNYGPMTTFHHRIKTHGRWQVRRPYAGVYVWRDPHGALYLVDHTGTRRTDPARAGRRRPSRLEHHFAELIAVAG